jgi:hypothetical protein
MAFINTARPATAGTVNRPQGSIQLAGWNALQNNPSLPDKQVSVLAEPVTAVFDYTGVAVGDAEQLRAHATRIRANIRSTTAAILAIGVDLIAAKQRLDHGQFSAWVEAECGFAVRSAERYIAAAKLAEGKNDTVSLLPPATVYALAAKSTPPEVIEAVISRVEAGEVLSNTVVKEMIDAGKPEQRPEQREKKRNKGERGRHRETPGRGPAHICRRVQQAIRDLAGLPPAAEVCRYFEQDMDLAFVIDERLSEALLWVQEFAAARKTVQAARGDLA